MQLLASCLVVGAIALVSNRQSYVLSALYGAMAVVIPNAAMARGISKRQAPNAESAVAAVMLWEMVKVAASVLLLMLATRVVENLSWPALLAGLVVTLKVNWLALAFRGQNSRSIAKSRTE
jgi:ATP synthase protein I